MVGKEAIANLQRIPLDIFALIHTITLTNVGFGHRNIISRWVKLKAQQLTLLDDIEFLITGTFRILYLPQGTKEVSRGNAE